MATLIKFPFCAPHRFVTVILGLCLGFTSLTQSFGATNKTTEIRIVMLEGTAEILPANATTWVLTQTNQVLHPSDRLRTGANSRVALLWSDQSIVPFGAHAEVEILAPQESNELSGLHLIQGILSFFHRDQPGRIRIVTRGAIAGIRGTEFVLAVENVKGTERTTLSVVDGEVQFTNQQGSLVLTNHQQAFADLGQAPVRTPGFISNNLLQWCFYYPAILDLRDLALLAEAEAALKSSLAAYRAGDLLTALAAYPASRRPASASEQLYHAALLLSVGQVEATETELARLTNPGSAPRANETKEDAVATRLAGALRQLIAAVKRQSDRSTPNPRLSTELLAASYYEQSRAIGEASLQAALGLARQAATNSPDFGFAWERVAELEFSFGRTARAAEALDRSLALSPRNAQSLALKGFLLAAVNHTRQAITWFDQALAVDPALGNARLGRGLCRIHLGDNRGGREDLLVAAALEPQRAVLRSYLSKAFANANDDRRATHELGLAKDLDPNDPTSWLYSAFLNERDNRINDAVGDLEKSLALNDNRRVYRSELLLDQDRAVRSASLASIYREAGMTEVSLREAARAVTYDYANYSAHLFLANSFDALRDPTRFNLRYETPWFNELLLANLLAPPGAGTISPNISQQEYFRLFEQDRVGISSTTEARSDGQYREVVSQFGSAGPLSYSLDLDWQRNEGVRPNNDLTRSEWYSQVKFQITPQDSIFFLTKYEDYHSGDNFQYFDPGLRSFTTNSFTGSISTNTAFRRFFRFDEFQTPIAIGAYHHEWAPGIHTLALGGRLINEQQLSDKDVPIPILTLDPADRVTGVSRSMFDVSYGNRFETWISELNQIFQINRHTLVLGGRYQAGQFETTNWLANTTTFNSFFPTVATNVVQDMQRWSVYSYDTWEMVLSRLWLTAGIAYDRVEYPLNFRQVPVSAGQASADSLGPKGALIWSPSPMAAVRFAYSESLGGVSLDESYRLEPAQLAGFNQSYRTIIPESVAGSVTAPKLRTFGGALDLKFGPRTYVGFEGEILSSDVDRVLGIYRFPDSSGFGFASSTPEQLRYHEHSASVALNQLLSDEWAMGLSYKFLRSELSQAMPEVGTRGFDQADLHNISAYLLYQHPSGFFGRAEANWYLQENLTGTGASPSKSPGDDFAQLNLWAGFRFRRSLGDLSIGLLNVTGGDYKLNPLNAYNELPRERVVAGRVRLRF